MPATTGDAIEVPLIRPYSSPGKVLRMLFPGAVMSLGIP